MKTAVLILLAFYLSCPPAGAANSPDFVRAAENRNLGRMKELLKEGADINSFNRTRATALHHAARNEDVEMVEFLLANGAEPSLKMREAERNGTPLEWVTFHGRPAMVKLLLDRGSKVTDLDWLVVTKLAESGPPAGEQARKEDYLLIIEYFKAAGFADRKDLFSACARGNLAMAKQVLADHPEALQTKTKAGDEFGEGRDPVVFAAGSPSREILILLIETGGKIDAVDLKGNTPLHASAGSGTWQNLLYLLSLGADFEVKNLEGSKPIDLAVKRYRWLNTELLIQAGATVSDELRQAKTSPAISSALQGGHRPIILQPAAARAK